MIAVPRPVHRIATPEQLDRLDEALLRHNKDKYMSSDTRVKKWAEVAVTGKFSEYYTLWFNSVGPSAYGGKTTYVKNICKDIEGLIEFVENSEIPFPIDVVPMPTISNGYRAFVDGIPTMPIGKYRGAKLDEVFKNDPQYILWFAKNYKKESSRLSNSDVAVLGQANALVELFWKEKTEANRENCKSEFIGTLKKRMNHKGRVLFCKRMQGFDGETESFKVDLVDENDNLFYIYAKVLLEKDEVIEFRGTPAQHKEIVGRKKTYFNRVEILKK